MAYGTNIADVLNQWADMGVFAYVIPFLLIFAVVFAILHKTKLFGGENRSINAVIAGAIGLLALQFDFVSSFYAEIFPRFGVGLAIFLVLIIALGFFVGDERGKMQWIGWVVGIGVVVWALVNWSTWGDNFPSIGLWIEEYFWSIIVLALVITAIWLVADTGRKRNVMAKGTGPGRVQPE